MSTKTRNLQLLMRALHDCELDDHLVENVSERIAKLRAAESGAQSGVRRAVTLPEISDE